MRSIEVVVTAQPIPCGSRLDAEELRPARRTSSQLRGKYYTDLQGLVGLQTRRAVQRPRADGCTPAPDPAAAGTVGLAPMGEPCGARSLTGIAARGRVLDGEPRDHKSW